MFDMEDFFGMGYEEEPELPNDLVQGGCEPEGEGWGSFLLGGAIGCMMGAGSGKNSQLDPANPSLRIFQPRGEDLSDANLAL